MLSQTNDDARPALGRGARVFDFRANFFRTPAHEHHAHVLNERTPVTDTVIPYRDLNDSGLRQPDRDSHPRGPRMLSYIDHRLRHDPIEQHQMRPIVEALTDGVVRDLPGTLECHR